MGLKMLKLSQWRLWRPSIFGHLFGGINPSETHLLVKPIEMMEVKAICLGVLTPLISIVRELSTIDSMENHTSWAPGHVGSDGTSATTSSSSICSHCSIMMAPQFGRFYYHQTCRVSATKSNPSLHRTCWITSCSTKTGQNCVFCWKT